MKKFFLIFVLLGTSLTYGNSSDHPTHETNPSNATAWTVLWGFPAVNFGNTIFCGYTHGWCAVLFTEQKEAAPHQEERILVQVQDERKTTFTASRVYSKVVNPDQSTIYTFSDVIKESD